LASDEKFLSYL
jgi:hypothetical protein